MWGNSFKVLLNSFVLKLKSSDFMGWVKYSNLNKQTVKNDSKISSNDRTFYFIFILTLYGIELKGAGK